MGKGHSASLPEDSAARGKSETVSLTPAGSRIDYLIGIKGSIPVPCFFGPCFPGLRHGGSTRGSQLSPPVLLLTPALFRHWEACHLRLEGAAWSQLSSLSFGGLADTSTPHAQVLGVNPRPWSWPLISKTLLPLWGGPQNWPGQLPSMEQ